MAKPKPQKFLVGTMMYVLLFVGAKERIRGSDTDNKCGGEERWEQKVLIDPEAQEIHEKPIVTTIAELQQINTKLPENKYQEGKPRMEIEKQVYTIKNCFITDIIREDDNDLHLVIEDGNKNSPHTMIAEIPDPKCPQAQKSDWVGEYQDVQKFLLDHAENYRHFQFTITGVLFVDKAHGQTGKAPNSVEIHPILKIKIERQINPILQ
ncbi:MAG TPA: hypothetical protein PKM63_17340 [Panacibacter sp.]|nr:hypothetical protein [Panacibacter sp.]HNP46061.1 hypothetical protein [Panacibacter sp.]